MFRLVVVSCLALGIALAKPNPQREAVPYGDDGLVPYLDAVSGRNEPLPLKFDGSRAAQKLPVGDYLYTSPNYPDPYPNSVSESFTVEGQQGQDISISCNPFSLHITISCFYEYLSINGKRYCGTRIISTITASQLSVVFRSYRWVARSGFKCLITVPQAGATTQAPATTAAPPAPPTTAAPAPPSSGDCRCGQRQSGRVVGGTEADVGAFPWQAGIVPPGGTRTFCGGSVINDRYVLTAAHCTANSTASDMQVLLGDHQIGAADAGEQRYSVVEIIDHPLYKDASGTGWDFSLLKLDRKITFSSTIAPVCLAEAGQTYAGVTATASGFGRLGANSPQATSLQQVNLPVWSEADCKQSWGATIKSNMICAGGKSTGGEGVCMGDSGGPLVTEVSGSFRLIGVVSFGQPCAIANSPDVFARVSEAVSWITANTADAQYCSA